MKNVYTFFILVILGSSFLSSCHKKKDTTAKITIRNVANEIIVGASVRVYSVSTTTPTKASTVDETKLTDLDGVVTFNYNDIYQSGQAGVAVLNIDANYTRTTPTLTIISGSGVIKIEAEKENTATLILN